MIRKRIVKTVTLAIMLALICSGCCVQHEWAEATCGTPRTCQVCGKTKGEPTGEHVWIEANCDTSKHCSVCGKYEGSPLGHTWKDATCTEARTCTRCGLADGGPLGHQYDRDDFVCARCGEETVFSSSDMKEILSQSVNDYSSFCKKYLGKTFVMEVWKSDIENGTLYGANMYADDTCFFTVYKPAEGEKKLLEAGGFPVIRAKLDSVMRGFFDGQYIVFFKDATLEEESWYK